MSKHIIDGLTVTGQVGTGMTTLMRALTLAQATHEASGPAFTDRTTEARTEGGTAYSLLGATTDRFYIGYDEKFPGIRIDLDVAGAGLATVWEYWNGSAWTALSGVAGGGLTADGAVTWTVPGDWAKTTVNAGNSLYFIRVRTTTITTGPTAFFSVVNWTIYDDAAGTNQKVFKSIGEDGTSTLLLWADDNGPTDAQRMAFRFYETWDNVGHTGTAPTPTVAQVTLGVQWRKSSTTDATARGTTIYVSRDSVMLFSGIGDTGALTGFNKVTANCYLGKFTSYVAGDAFNICLCGAATIASTGEQHSITNGGGSFTSGLVGHYIQRAYPGSGASINNMAWGGPAPGMGDSNAFTYPNGPNGGILINPKLLSEPIGGTSMGHIRGELASLVLIPHLTSAALVNGDTFTDPATGKKYWIIRSDIGNVSGLAPWCGVEVPA